MMRQIWKTYFQTILCAILEWQVCIGDTICSIFLKMLIIKTLGCSIGIIV
jgi:hypothetical protein